MATHPRPFRSVLAKVALALLVGTQLLPAVPETRPVSGFVEDVRILGSLSHGNLTLVAVRGGGRAGRPDLATLDEAMSSGKVVVSETAGGGTVNTLVLRNQGDRPLFIMAGEILAGAKQDRILQQDIVLPAGGGSVQVPAFCVEHGRWREQSTAFYSEKVAAPVAVRRAAQASKDQSVVWAEVASNNSAVAASAPTGTLSATYKSGRVVEVRKSFMDALSGLPRNFPSARGVVVMVNGKAVGADLFRDPGLFGRLWPKLLDSYIAEAVRQEKEAPSAAAAGAEAFLELARKSRITLEDAPGSGRQITLEGAGLKGAGVLLEAPIHLDLFPFQAGTARTAVDRERLHRQNIAPPSSLRH